MGPTAAAKLTGIRGSNSTNSTNNINSPQRGRSTSSMNFPRIFLNFIFLLLFYYFNNLSIFIN